MSTLANNTAIPPVISPAPALFKLIALTVFIENKNLVVKMLSLIIGTYVTTNNVFTIWIYDQAFPSWSKLWKWVYQI